MSQTLIENVRVAFEKIKVPDKKQGKDGSYDEYSVTLLTDVGVNIDHLLAVLRAEAAQGHPKMPFASLASPIQDAAKGVNLTTGEPYSGFETAGHSIKCKSYKRPALYAADGKSELPIDALYNGMYVNAIVTPKCWTWVDMEKQKGMVKKGVRFTIHGLQFVKHGPPLKSATQVNVEFEPVAGAADDTDAANFLNSVRGG